MIDPRWDLQPFNEEYPGLIKWKRVGLEWPLCAWIQDWHAISEIRGWDIDPEGGFTADVVDLVRPEFCPWDRKAKHLRAAIEKAEERIAWMQSLRVPLPARAPGPPR